MRDTKKSIVIPELYKTLRIRNLSPNTTVPRLARAFTKLGFEVAAVKIELIGTGGSEVFQARVAIPASDVDRALMAIPLYCGGGGEGCWSVELQPPSGKELTNKQSKPHWK